MHLAAALWLVFVPCIGTAQTAMNTTRTYVPNGTTDGIAVGDTDGDSVLELAVVSRGGTYNAVSAVTGLGTLALLKADGTLKWQQQTGEEFAGFPVFLNYDTDAWKEVMACESAYAGYCRVYDGDGSILASLGPFNFPGVTNGGPTVGDINGDKRDDVIVHAYGGEITAYSGGNGAILWQKDMYALYNELFFGHGALRDIDNDGTLEFVLVGHNTGALYIINAENGSVQASSPSMWSSYGNVAYGSGIAFANLDSDSALEMVSLQWSLTAAGSTPAHAAIAFETNGAVKWRKVISGADFSYMSPVAADADRSNYDEVYAQSNNGTLYVLDRSGNILRSTSHSTQAWASPSFMDVNLGGSPEVIVSGLSGMKILAGTNFSTVHYAYTNSNSMVYPQPIQTDIDADGSVELITGAWYPKQALFFDMALMATYNWGAFAGSDSHAGLLVENAQGQMPDRLVAGMQVLRARLDAAIANYSGTVRTKLQGARTEMSDCMRDYLRGSLNSAATNCRESVSKMQEAVNAGYNINSTVYYNRDPRPMAVWIMLLMTDQFAERTYTGADYNNADLVTARTNRTNCLSKFNSSNFTGASVDCENAIKKISPAGNNYASNLCSSVTPSYAYTPWQCQILDAYALLRTIYGSSHSGITTLAAQLDKVRHPKYVDFTTAHASAESAFGTVSPANAGARAALSQGTSMIVYSLYLDAAQYSGAGAAGVTTGKSLWDQGESARLAGDYATAASKYKSAALSLVP